MPARTGKQYIESLSAISRRACIYLNGERVRDVTEVPVFQGPINAVAALYDMQHDPRYKDYLTYPSPTTGDRVSIATMLPRTQEELTRQRQGFKLHTDHSFGFMGRAPHFMLGMITGWYRNQETYALSGEQFRQNAVNYYEYVRENDIFMTHVLINPQIDRSKSSSEQEDPFIHLGKVRETDEGIIIRGAKMLGTMGPLTEELVVVPFGGIAPGEHDYALVFAIPVDAPGLKLICREPFGHPNQHFDHPLSSRFEEIDCFAIFDDVLVPWERVIVPGRPGSEDILNGAARREASSATGLQTASQMLSQMELAVGVALRLADSVGITQFLHVQEKLGEMILMLEMCRMTYYGAEAHAVQAPDGVVSPAGLAMRCIRLLGIQMYERMLEITRILAGGGFFQAPTEQDMNNPEIRPYIDKFMRGRAGFSADERLRIFKLAWDICGDAFGMRAQQYVHFHGGDPIRLMARVYLAYDKEPLLANVNRALYDTDTIEVTPDRPYEPKGAPPAPSGPMLAQYPAGAVPQPKKPTSS